MIATNDLFMHRAQVAQVSQVIFQISKLNFQCSYIYSIPTLYTVPAICAEMPVPLVPPAHAAPINDFMLSI